MPCLGPLSPPSPSHCPKFFLPPPLSMSFCLFVCNSSNIQHQNTVTTCSGMVWFSNNMKNMHSGLLLLPRPRSWLKIWRWVAAPDRLSQCHWRMSQAQKNMSTGLEIGCGKGYFYSTRTNILQGRLPLSSLQCKHGVIDSASISKDATGSRLKTAFKPIFLYYFINCDLQIKQVLKFCCLLYVGCLMYNEHFWSLDSQSQSESLLHR